METEKIEKKGLGKQTADLFGRFFLFILLLVVTFFFFMFLYLVIEIIFENPISLAIICVTGVILAIILEK